MKKNRSKAHHVSNITHKKPLIPIHKELRKVMSPCDSCLYLWPEQFVHPMFISNEYGSGYVKVCAICANEIQPLGLHAKMATSVLEAQRLWLELPEGRGFLTIQNWNRYWMDPMWFDPAEQYKTDKTDRKGFFRMITTIVRFSYANVFQPAPTPSGDMKYSISILVPKDDAKGVEEINSAIQEAINKGVEKGVFPKSAVKSLRLPLRDGDEEYELEKRGPEYRGFYFFNASSKNQPGVVDAKARPVMDEMDFYSGCWGRADVNFFPYNQAGNKGIGAGLNNLMKVKDDDRLDGRQKAEDAFAKYAEESGGDEPPFDTDDNLT